MSILDEYVARTPSSAAMFERATRALPGGSTRTTVFALPYPPYMKRGEGIWIEDVDGNRYRDFLLNYTVLILGHAHPAVVAAVERETPHGSPFGAPTESEVELAEELVRRLPSMDLVRFTTTGTEATMLAIRAARASTGRSLIGRFDRSYHGTHDAAMAAGSPGIPREVAELVVDLPWSDQAGIEAALSGRARDLAAIIVEPVQVAGGVRAASLSFLGFLRELTRSVGALLIFDEVISFRLGMGGVQGAAGIAPDLTTLGKIIGGGYPLGAFGGRADVMELFDARRQGAMSHGGTYNGNPVAAAAGLATLRELTPERFEHLDVLGERLRTTVGASIADGGLDARVAGVGSVFQVWAGEGIPAGATGAPVAELYMTLLNEGFYIAPRGMGALAVPMTTDDVDALAGAIVRVLERTRTTEMARV